MITRRHQRPGPVHLFKGAKGVNRFRRWRKPIPSRETGVEPRGLGGEQKQGGPARTMQARDEQQSPFPTASSAFAVRAARCESNLAVKGNRPASIRGPRTASTAGTRVFASNTLIPATSNPATPMERTSLMGTVKRARNPMATVEAEIRGVGPALRAAMTEALSALCPAEIASRKRLTMRRA